MRVAHEVPGAPLKVIANTEITMIDGKMVSLLQGGSGAFCHICDISKSDASNIHFLASAGVGGVRITRTVDECRRRWELLERGEIGYNDPDRASQCHKPLITKSGRLFAILHQELDTLVFTLKVLYHVVIGQIIWSEANKTVKSKVAEARVAVETHIKKTCGGFLVDSPNATSGSTNTGTVVKRFFHASNREAVCNLINKAED